MRLTLSISTLVAVLMLALPTASHAQSTPSTFSYRFVDLALFPQAEIDTGDDDVDGEGIQLRGSLPLHENFFVLTEIQILNLDRSVDTMRLAIGGGGHWPLGAKVDVIARAGVVNYQVDTGPYNDDDTGLFMGARLRAIVAPRLEVEGGFEYQDVELGGLDNDTYIVAEARYNFTSELSAGVIFNIGGDTSVFGVQGRYSF